MAEPAIRRPTAGVILALAALTISKAFAGTLPLPAGAQAARETIAADCPECLRVGVTACGTADVQYGRRFVGNFLAGEPARGYLPAFRISGREFTRLARRLPLAALIETVRARFADMPLVVVEDRFTAARIIAAPAKVDVTFPDALHQCLQNAARPWGCCVASDCRGECCEKSLGNPSVTASWLDDASGDRLTFSFGHAAGSSTLRRFSATGSTLYWCLTDEAGLLK